MMLYIVGTKREANALRPRLPKPVFDKLLQDVTGLDHEYGETRDYHIYGGYSLVAETLEDVQKITAYFDFNRHPCEWVEKIKSDIDYLGALYLINNDYSVMAYMPVSVAPDAILQEL